MWLKAKSVKMLKISRMVHKYQIPLFLVFLYESINMYLNVLNSVCSL